MNSDAWLLLGGLAGVAGPLAVIWLWNRFAVSVFPNETVLVLRFGRLARRVDAPGVHFVWDRSLPWVRVVKVSRRMQGLMVRDVEVHDVAGTELGADVFVEHRVADPVAATFAIEDLPRALENLVSHALIAVCGGQSLEALLRDNGPLADTVRADVAAEAQRWGVEVTRVMFRQLRPSPIAMEQLLGSIAARLDKAKARVEEEGRQAAHLHHARTQADVARLVGDARGQYAKHVGEAYAQLRTDPEVFAAFQALHELVLLHPGQTVAFRGFGQGELKPTDAAMFAPGGLMGSGPP